MKQLKYILSQLLLLCAVVGFTTSCEESEVEDSSTIEMSNEFSLLSFSGAMTTSGGEKIVIITTSDAWSATPSSDWIMLTADSGTSGKSSFYVSVEANNGTATRYGTIEIEAGNSHVTVIVEQTHSKYIDVARDSYSYDGREQTFTVLVSTNVGASNVDVTISAADQEWLSCAEPTINVIDTEVSELSYIFKVEAQADGDEAREASVVISYSKIGVGATFTVSQNQYPTIDVPDDASNHYTTPYYTSLLDIVVDSNMELTLEEVDSNGELVGSPSTWVTMPESYIADGTLKTYSFELESNNTTEDKDYYVRFGYYAANSLYIDELIISETIRITQQGKMVNIYVESDDMAIYTESQTYIQNNNFEVKVYSNVELTATSNATSWLNVAEGYSVEDIDEDDTNGDDRIYTYTFMLSQNDADGNIERDATVTFTNTVDNTKSASIKITQQEEKTFVAVSDKIDVAESMPYNANDSFEITITTNASSIGVPSFSADWITLSNTTPAGVATDVDGVLSYTYSFSIAENFKVGAATRSTDITFSGDSESDQVTLTQEARVPVVSINNYADINDATQLFNIGELTLNVTSDIPLMATSTRGDVTPTDAANSDFTTATTDFVVTIPDNEDSVGVATTTVTFANEEYGYSQSVTIYQEAMPTTLTVENSAAGLASLLTETDYTSYDRVVVTGTALTTDDFTAIKDKLSHVAYIDISATPTAAIPAKQFQNNTALIQFLFPQSTLTSVGTYAFSGSGLTSVTIPASLSDVGDYAFANTLSLKSVIFAQGAEVIGKWMFQNATALSDIKFVSSINSVGEKAFQNTTGLTSVDLSGLTILGYHMFYNSGFTTVTVPATIKTWVVDTTEGGVNYGLNMAFQACASLVTIELEDGLETLSATIVSNCESLASMVSYSVEPPTIINGQTLNGVLSYYPMNSGSVNKPIYVPEEAVEIYKTTEGWSINANSIYSIESLSLE